VIDYQDLGVLHADQATDVTDAALLHWLGLTRLPGSAASDGNGQNLHISWLPADFLLAAGSRAAIAHVPLPLYLQDPWQLSWLQILSGQRTVYLKYNLCLPGDQFQRLAATALAVLRVHPSYRLIIDLRNNPGGDSEPFQALVRGIQADPAINRRGRVFGLINALTNSSATVDAHDLGTETQALLVGQQVRDPIDEYGNDYGELKLPGSRLSVQYTTAVINGSKTEFGVPAIVAAPTLHDWLAGIDPVLSTALSYSTAR
jgi:hypothetical protein